MKRERENLDERLSAYYGPVLREQPLPPSAWQDLRSRLKSRNPMRRHMHWPWHLHGRRFVKQKAASPFIESAFTRIIYEARLRRSSSILAYSFKARQRQPQVRVILLARHNIRLKLPMRPPLEPAELDVLLATGLARYLCMRRPAYIVKRCLGYSLMALAGVALVWPWLTKNPFLVFSIAIALWIGLCSIVLWLLHRQGRQIALQADSLMVLWLGRGHVCRGLHALEARSRHPTRRGWGELSLTERIAHVCGSEVPMQHERLTLVR
ncbi:MAG: hypothetical protein ACJ788_23330 [Ktedonobacteraceae bacterium]